MLAQEQVLAAKESATAEREHSRLIREQLLASLRPVIVAFWHAPDAPMRPEQWLALQNQAATAIAFDLRGNFLSARFPDCVVPLQGILGPGAMHLIRTLPRVGLKPGKLEVRYGAADGRVFRANIFIDELGVIRQEEDTAMQTGPLQPTHPLT